ncbi:MAG TPA: SET domain-containing protein [Pyrinomonadaceae bacterium]
MLLVKTQLLPSDIQGLGLFADENILTGQEVWRFVDGFDVILPLEMFESLPPLAQAFIRRYGTDQSTEGYFTLYGDDARFLNHSSHPNLAWDERRQAIVADKNICVGEELTENYYDNESTSTDRVNGRYVWDENEVKPPN